MNIEVKKEDILKIGGTTFELKGCTAFVIDSDSSFWIQEIFLRNILKTFSEEYKITSIEDYELDENEFFVTKMLVTTDLPWEVYEQLNHTF